MVLPPRETIDHAAGRPQHWYGVDPDIGQWVDDIVSQVEESVSSLLAVYLHGSLALGSYFRPKSDIDILVVADEPLSERDRRALAAGLLHAHDRRPTLGSVELSVVLRRRVEDFRHPLPYEFHFSEKWAEHVREGGVGPRGTDPDLAAHCAMARSRGLVLHGREPGELIGPVPHDAYVDAIVDDFHWIVSGGILESPFYGVLNICRVLQVVADEPDVPPSKEEAAHWALQSLPADHHLAVSEALECYRSAAQIPADQRQVHGHRWSEQALLHLAAFARRTVTRDTPLR